jgi:uncharacterized protein YecE (DUF72 family)
VFYPKGLPQHRELAYAASRFRTIKVNGTFYTLQCPGAFAAWAAEVPEDFVFAVKGSRYITHMLKLRDAGTALANSLASGVLRLGPKLGPVLWQLPPNLGFDEERLAVFLAALPCDTQGRPGSPGGTMRALPAAPGPRRRCGGRCAPRWKCGMRVSAPRRQARDVFIYFDNDAKPRAPADALALMERLRSG